MIAYGRYKFYSKQYPTSWIVWEYTGGTDATCVEAYHPNWKPGHIFKKFGQSVMYIEGCEFIPIKTVKFNSLYNKLNDGKERQDLH